jgi:hypothetical protein
MELTPRIVEAYQAIPHTIRIGEALAMSWGGERNLAMRKALGIALEADDVCMVGQDGLVQVVVPSSRKAREVAAKLEAGLPTPYQVGVTKRPDRLWLVTATP